MSLALSYVAGVVAALSPCVLPVLPVVATSATRAHRAGALVLAAGAILTFTAAGFLLSATGSFLGLDDGTLRSIAGIMLVTVGLLLVLPRLGKAAGTAVFGRFASFGGERLAAIKSDSLFAQFGIGSLIGLVWTPCVGPTLGAAMALVAQGDGSFRAAGSMLLFGVGIMSPFLAIAYGLRGVILKRTAAFSSAGRMLQQIFGALLLLLGLSVLTGLDKTFAAWAFDAMPAALNDFIYSF